MIDKATIDRIFAAANIVEVVGDFVTLKKKGINYQACCPFHNEKTPSFVVSPSKGLFKCFGCGKGGNAVTFVMEHENMTYPEALKYVARKYGIEVAEREQTPEEVRRNDDRESMMVVSSYAADYFVRTLHDTPEGQSIGIGYFRERGFSDATIRKFGLGYCPDGGDTFTRQALADGYKEEFLVGTGLTIKRETGGYYDRFCGRVMFPIHGISGRVTAFGGRTMRTDKKVAKYLNSPESEIYHKSDVLYGIYFAKRAITQQDCCILVEGYTDVISMHQSGIENVVASSGTSLTDGQIRLIGRFTRNVTVIYDGDSAGIKASLRGIDMILKDGLNVRVVLLPDGDDPDSFARKHNATELRDFILSHEEDFISFKTRLLLAEAAGDPLRKAALIADIVQSISVIPDAITRSVYTRECSRQMEIDEQILLREIALRRVEHTAGSEAKEFIRNQEIIRRYYHCLCELKRGNSSKDILYKLQLLMKQAGLTINDRPVVNAAMQREQETGHPAVAIELSDGTLVTGKTTDLLGAASACLLNSLKVVEGIDHEVHLVSPQAIEPIQTLKTSYLGSINPRLHTDEILIALSISAATDKRAALALSALRQLKGCEVHSSVMLSSVDEAVFKKLGMHLTCEPKTESDNQQ